MTDSLVDRTGMPVDANSIYARQSPEVQERITAWFGHDTELGGYDLDAVKDLGKHTI